MASLTLVLGGARSGKSTFAEGLAARSGNRILYVATAEACDDEMSERIRQHRLRRPPTWTTLEAPLEPVAALRSLGQGWDAVLLDSVSIWVSNLLLRAPQPDGLAPADLASRVQREALEALLDLEDWRRVAEIDLVLVSDEVGMGIVPVSPLGRTYRDLLGTVNQALAAKAELAYLVVAGLPLQLKGPGTAPISVPIGSCDDPNR